MSELKDYNIMDIEAMDDERLEKSESGKIQVTRVYIKYEADKVITELEAKNRRLERSLYKACANWAKEFRYKIGFAISSMNTKYDYSDADKWLNVERKCRAKAKEYK